MRMRLSSLPKKQSGAALVVGLIVLLVMTLLGVASMGSMTTELRMAANVQNHNTAFQAATAAIEAIRADPAINWDDPANFIVGAQIATQPAANFEVKSGDSLATTEAVIVYSGCKTVMEGDSLTQEGGSPYYIHEIQVTGQALNSSNDVVGESVQVQGLITTKALSCG